MPVLLVLSHKCAVRVMRRLPSSWRKHAQTSSWDKPLWCVSLGVYKPIEWLLLLRVQLKSTRGSDIARFGSEPQTLAKSIKVIHQFQ